MDRFEYKFENVFRFAFEEEMKLLNEEGANGWQLVGRDRGGFYFMRRIQEDKEEKGPALEWTPQW